MTYSLFLDDERFPAGSPPVGNDWFIARSYKEAINIAYDLGLPSYISFDHDLGHEKTGYDFAKWLVEAHMYGILLPSDFQFYVHSQNPIGKQNIESYLNSFLKTINI